VHVPDDGATRSGNISAENSARWPGRDRALRGGVEAGHLPAPGSEPLPLRVAASVAQGRDLPDPHCRRGSRDLSGRALTRPCVGVDSPRRNVGQDNPERTRR
jgi:hypothetical protein